MPMGYYYGYDYTWYLLVLPAFLLALWAQFKVKATYSKYSKVRSLRGRTAAEVARQIENGSLIEALPGWAPAPEVLHGVFASRRGLVSSVRALIDYLAEAFAQTQKDR